MKIYLAGPMRGLPLFNFPAFDEAAAKLRSEGHTVFNPAEQDRAAGFNPATDTAHDTAYYMAIDLPEVCRADAIALLPNWEKSSGVRIELIVAIELGKRIITL